MSDVRNPQQFKLYHGTTRGKGLKIMEEGLRAGEGPHQVHSISATEDPHEAWSYAHEKHASYEDPKVFPDKRPVLIEFDAPDIPHRVQGTAHYFHETIPPEKLKMYERYEAQTQILDKAKKRKPRWEQ